MIAPEERPFRVVQCVELGAAAPTVWQVVGGFYNIHAWHPDIAKTNVPANQTSMTPLCRELTFSGQPITTEELIAQDNIAWYYKYKWFSGEWGERVRNYHAELRVIEIEPDRRCLVQWSSTFVYTEDAVSEFYWNGFRELQKRFPLPK